MDEVVLNATGVATTHGATAALDDLYAILEADRADPAGGADAVPALIG